MWMSKRLCFIRKFYASVKTTHAKAQIKQASALTRYQILHREGKRQGHSQSAVNPHTHEKQPQEGTT